ncbi:hypothetical protein AN639_10305 [Candidatus Epulonipiscium fishelsonii]|uniref:Uncharacterized protein n=1 Tax=Candidatus Epulonipiscium fishelsonii TaxID=77094 RepID=A0ACC8XBZ2_9FIRM|nr:hypothetical protein AN396_01035 [Epulopiscium sp. SCG-B11WGA-EpuloA1]ONI43571.1 hypothetical protein AN639_10305 [Epulopiscium sp. SCG-B05WGA-EpuloA1]ONI47045.1 hypothetical protein AN644_01815 [Epulopiscium sp. SCG-C06WGA-EpuloA1]
MELNNILAGWYDKKYQLAVGNVIKGFRITKKIGEGRFGKVYLAEKNDKKIIIKQLKHEAIFTQPHKIKFEVSTLKDIAYLKDKRFPLYLGKFKLPHIRGYILEYKTGETLERIIFKNKRKFSRVEIYDFALQILDMVDVLHAHNIVHKDIRIPNLILQNEELCLIDFGLARYIDNKRYKTDLDFWYLGDFMIHLFYTNYDKAVLIDRPWYKQLDLYPAELILLKRLMRIDKKKYPPFNNTKDIRNIIKKLRENTLP